MTDRELLDIIASQVSTLTTQGDTLVARANTLTDDLNFVKGTVVKIEIEHGQKLGALADGYKDIGEKLDRIEKEVTRHDEIILRKVL